jgi:hypothetical protein
MLCSVSKGFIDFIYCDGTFTLNVISVSEPSEQGHEYHNHLFSRPNENFVNAFAAPVVVGTID